MINIPENLPEELQDVEIGFAKNISTYTDRIIKPILDSATASLPDGKLLNKYTFNSQDGQKSLVLFNHPETNKSICAVGFDNNHHPTLYI